MLKCVSTTRSGNFFDINFHSLSFLCINFSNKAEKWIILYYCIYTLVETVRDCFMLVITMRNSMCISCTWSLNMQIYTKGFFFFILASIIQVKMLHQKKINSKEIKDKPNKHKGTRRLQSHLGSFNFREFKPAYNDCIVVSLASNACHRAFNRSFNVFL